MGVRALLPRRLHGLTLSTPMAPQTPNGARGSVPGATTAFLLILVMGLFLFATLV